MRFVSHVSRQADRKIDRQTDRLVTMLRRRQSNTVVVAWLSAEQLTSPIMLYALCSEYY